MSTLLTPLVRPVTSMCKTCTILWSANVPYLRSRQSSRPRVGYVKWVSHYIIFVQWKTARGCLKVMVLWLARVFHQLFRDLDHQARWLLLYWDQPLLILPGNCPQWKVSFLNSFHVKEVNPHTQEVAMNMRAACLLVGGTHLHQLSPPEMLTVLSIRGIFLIRAWSINASTSVHSTASCLLHCNHN